MRDDDLAGELARTVSGLHRASRRRTGAVMPGGALPAAQGELLVVVARQPGIGVAAAADELQLAGNSVSTLVNALAEAGLLRRDADPADRRAARLSLTAAGERWIAAWRDARAAPFERALERTAPGDRATVAAALPALRRLLDALRDDGPDVAP